MIMVNGSWDLASGNEAESGESFKILIQWNHDHLRAVKCDRINEVVKLRK